MAHAQSQMTPHSPGATKPWYPEGEKNGCHDVTITIGGISPLEKARIGGELSIAIESESANQKIGGLKLCGVMEPRGCFECRAKLGLGLSMK